MHNATIGPNIVSSEAICEPDVIFPWKNRNDEIKTTVQNFIEKTKYTQKLLVIELEKHLKYQKNRKKQTKQKANCGTWTKTKRDKAYCSNTVSSLYFMFRRDYLKLIE